MGQGMLVQPTPTIIRLEKGPIPSPTPPITPSSEYWYDASIAEVLIDSRSKLEERPIILSKNNDAIAKWIDCRYKDRAKAMKAIARRTGQLTILRSMKPIVELEDNTNTISKLAYKMLGMPLSAYKLKYGLWGLIV